MVDWQSIASDIANDHNITFDPGAVSRVTGGDIARSFRCRGSGGSYFIKLQAQAEMNVLAAEAEGAMALSETGALRVPAVYGIGISPPWAYLILEWVDFGNPTEYAQQRLGAALAALHRTTTAEHGWPRPNFIGATPQMNQPLEDWPEFYRQRRLLPQLALANSHGFATVAQRGMALVPNLDKLLDHGPAPSLLHGDLWSGNWGVDQAGQPVVFDTAVYFGDRETDLAMTRLFGGFSAGFYAAYETTWPLPVGWRDRLPAYQLYHVLNHLNLFGGGYVAQAVGLIDELERLV